MMSVQGLVIFSAFSDYYSIRCLMKKNFSFFVFINLNSNFAVAVF